MGILQNLAVPVIAAPMAGGPSTPALVNAVGAAGGLGFLAGATISVERLQEDLQAARGKYGVNLFTRQDTFPDPAEVVAVATELAAVYHRLELGEPEPVQVDYSNGWADKLRVIQEAAAAGYGPAVVSATFGCFSAAEITALQAAGIEAWVTVTNPEDARTAALRGADALVVQGPAAGGHRSTWDIHVEPDPRPLAELMAAVAAVTADLPLIAAGGLGDAAAVHQALNWPQVAAVSCGTAFLRADEADTSPTNRDILAAAGEGATVSTRAFSGRFARGVATDYTRRHPDTPAIYPQLNQLLAPVRAAAARRANPDFAYCLAGTGAGRTQSAPAAEILHGLAP